MTLDSPTLILFSHDIELIRNSGCRSGTGGARLFDFSEGLPEVVHLLPRRHNHSGGHDDSCLSWQLDGDKSLKSTAADNSAINLRIDTKKEFVSATCDLRLGDRECLDLVVTIVQTGTQTFSRSTPILESQLLSESCVLCVGLGSGGSIVADQLARSGVGEFILWDFDRLESHNISRHLCTISDLGRKKINAVKDHIKSVNPNAKVSCIDRDVLDAYSQDDELEAAIEQADCIVVGTDNNASRYAINEIAWKHKKCSLYGRAFTRASGGDVVQVVPDITPCYACHTETRVVEEEISSERDADQVAYADTEVAIEPGLVIDIHPIASMLARLALLRLCEKFDSSLKSLAAEMDSPLYLWANRREGQFTEWQPMERSFDRMAILRWYAVGVPRNRDCTVCGYSSI